MAERSGIFISYSHRDKRWLNELKTALQPLVDNEIIVPWTDRDIKPGDDWLAAIDKAVALARMTVLLVSQAFLASSFIHRKELPDLLARREQGLGFFWVPIEATLYEYGPLGAIQCAGDPGRPLAALSKSERAVALVEIARKIADWRVPVVTERLGG